MWHERAMPCVSRTRNVQYTRTSPIVRPIPVFPGVHCRDRRARGSDCLSREEQQAWYRASGIVSPKKKKFDQRAVLRWFKISPLRTQKSWSNVRDNSAKIDFGRPGLGLWFRRDEFSMSFGLLVKETLFFTSSSVASSQLSLSIAYVVLREVAFPRAFALRARNEFRPTADPTRCALFG